MNNPLISVLPGHSQLRRLVILRSVAIAAQLLTLLSVWHFLEMALDWSAMLITIATLAGINLFTWLRLRGDRPVSNPELFVQLGIDVLALSVLLYYGGGSTNPFVSLFLLPLVIAAATLPMPYTWGMALLTTASYSVLMFYYQPLPHSHHDHNSDSAFTTHVMGMWLGFFISAVVVAYFVTQMAQAVRKRDEQLARAREEILRNERIVALGTQAAGAAHEMGTPLSTMAVVINELQHELGAEPSELRDSLEILDEQVRGCKRILDKILSNAQEEGATSILSVDAMMAEVLDEWQLLRPTAVYQYQAASTPAKLAVDTTLRAALMNLLNNAADASPQGIEIVCRCDEKNFILTVIDHGAGLSEEVARYAGSAFFTTKQEGRGLGLMLANATVERLGGTVSLLNNHQGGASTELILPLAGASI